jgi:hypothetical protein
MKSYEEKRKTLTRNPMDFYDGSSEKVGEERSGLDGMKYQGCGACGLPQTGGECAFCGKDLGGQFHFHRKGFRKVKLCEGCYQHQGFQLHVPKMGPAMTKAKAPRAALSDADFTIPTDGRNPGQPQGQGKTMHYITPAATEKPQEALDEGGASDEA